MSMIESRQAAQSRIESKRLELLAKFSDELRPLIYNDPVARVVFESLSRDESPYKIIEILLGQNKELRNMLEESHKKQLPTPMILDKASLEMEYFNKLKAKPDLKN